MKKCPSFFHNSAKDEMKVLYPISENDNSKI
jgi:hypothetical protein